MVSLDGAFHIYISYGIVFVLAGAVYYCSNYKKFMEKKAKRILGPYVFFGIITLLLKAFGGSAINGVESTGEGIIKFLFHGGNYWFLYVLFILFAIYPWIEKVCKKWEVEAAFAVFVLVVRQFNTVTSFLSISTLLYYIPYFVAGKLISRKIYSGRGTASLSGRTKRITLLTGAVLYCLLECFEISRGEDLGNILSFIRAMSIIAVLYVIVGMILKNSSGRQGLVYNLVTDCGKYSLQLYLFNGFLLTALRIVICNVMKITSPIIIVGGIWIGNLVITLVACKYIIPRIPILRELCGLK